VPAPVEDVWRVIGDPHHLPRWWPLTERVESVGPDGWTSVLRSSRGKMVRADYRVAAEEPLRHRAWTMDVVGGPFERLLREHRTEVELEEAGPGSTAVTLSEDQRARGTARLGGFLVRRAARARLDAALAALDEVLR
jgi:uncharacterized protein YndB with AHSA1/START domain